MSKAMSIMLDLLRFLAAMAVVVGHLTQSTFSEGWPDLTINAVAAVAVFFVLSGFVICYVTDRKEKDVMMYVVARLSRLYSVLVPALLLSGIVLILGLWLDPVYVRQWYILNSKSVFLFTHPGVVFLARCALSLSFLNMLHDHNNTPAINSPIWSLGYEAAYYLIFGIAVFARGYRRLVLIVVSCFLFGVGIVSLMPIWFAGVGLQRFTNRIALIKTRQTALGIACFLGVAIGLAGWPMCNAWMSRRHQGIVETLLHGLGTAPFAGVFYFWGVLTCLFLLGVACFDGLIGRVVAPWEKMIRWCAGHTFSMYLFHFPLLVLMNVLLHYNRRSSAAKIAVLLAVLGLCVLLSKISEDKKLWWRGLLQGQASRFFLKRQQQGPALP